MLSMKFRNIHTRSTVTRFITDLVNINHLSVTALHNSSIFYTFVSSRCLEIGRHGTTSHSPREFACDENWHGQNHKLLCII
jgi:hypothetical protein